MPVIENRTCDEIRVGDSATLTRTVTKDDVVLFATMSGDINPIHVDEEFARDNLFHKVVVHGMWGGALISTVLGTKLPGPGTVFLSQTMNYRRPILVGDTVTVSVTVRDIAPQRKVLLDCRAENERGEVLIEGTAEVVAPRKKIRREAVVLPEVRLDTDGKWVNGLVPVDGILEDTH